MSDVKRRRLEALYQSLDAVPQAPPQGSTRAAEDRTHAHGISRGAAPVAPEGTGAGSAQQSRAAAAAAPTGQRHGREADRPATTQHVSPEAAHKRHTPHGPARRRKASGGGGAGGPGGGKSLVYAPLPEAVARGSANGGCGPGLDVSALPPTRPDLCIEWVLSMLTSLMLLHPQNPVDPGRLASRLEDCIKRKVVFLHKNSERDRQAGLLRRGTAARRGSTREALQSLVTNTQAKRQHLYDLPAKQCRFDIFRPLHSTWTRMATHISGQMEKDSMRDDAKGVGAEERLDQMDWHGAFVTVVRCRSPALCGVEGIVVKHSSKALHVISPANKLHILPLVGTTFQATVGHHVVQFDGESLSPPVGLGSRRNPAPGTPKPNRNVDWVGF